ncbi:hypothetical protein LXL04_034502 [Taraxacum kok-saghyz]
MDWPCLSVISVQKLCKITATLCSLYRALINSTVQSFFSALIDRRTGENIKPRLKIKVGDKIRRLHAAGLDHLHHLDTLEESISILFALDLNADCIQGLNLLRRSREV